MDRELIAYEGNKFTIEWYFDVRGKAERNKKDYQARVKRGEYYDQE